MSEIAFGSSAAFSFIESPAHARDDPVTIEEPWALATWVLATHFQMGWPPLNFAILNPHSDARDKYLRQRRLVTNISDGETWDQTFNMDRVTGVVTGSASIFSPGWTFFAAAQSAVIEPGATATYMKITGGDQDGNPMFTLELFNASPNAFGLAAIRCAALLDSVNIDVKPLGSFTIIFYQDDPLLPNPGSIITDVALQDIGEFPYKDFHDLQQSSPNSDGMAAYSFNTEDKLVDDWPALYFAGLAYDQFRNIETLKGTGDQMTMLKSKVVMHGDLCVTSKRTLFETGAFHEHIEKTEEIIKCLPFILAAPESDGSRTVKFNPPCKQGYYFWNVDAWPKHFAEVDGEQVVIPDYPVACDLPNISGGDPNCSTSPT